MTFTMKSASVAVVLALIYAFIFPVTVKFSIKVSVVKFNTSGLELTYRWSSTCQELQLLSELNVDSIGLFLYGIGFEGSLI